MAEVVSYALQHNPDLAVARFAVDSSRAEQRIAGALPNPAFVVAPGSPVQYSVNAPLDIGPNRLYRTRAAAQGAAASRLDAQNTRREVMFAIRQSFLDLLLAEDTRAVAFDQDTIIYHLLQNDSLRFQEGDLALRDLTTTELQYAHADAALSRADASARAARISLQLLMGTPHPDTAFRVTGALDYRPVALTLDSMAGQDVAERPDVAAATMRVEQGRSRHSLATSLIVPIPGVAAVYQAQPFETGAHYALGLSITVPVFDDYQGERQRAEAGVRAAEVTRQRTVAAAEGDLAAALDDLQATRTLAARYAAGLLATARNTLDMQRFSYEHGNASLLDLLNALIAFGDTQTDYYTASHDYWVAVYAVDRAVGRDVVP